MAVFLQVVLRAPAVLELSVDETLLPRVAFLRDTVGVAEENLGKVILRLPSVLTYSEESMQQRIDFLLEAGLCQEDLAKAVTSHPQVPPGIDPRRASQRRGCHNNVSMCMRPRDRPLLEHA